MKLKNAVFLFIAILILTSCSSNKQTLTYFENLPAGVSGKLGKSTYNIRIVPDDELLITVNSSNPLATYDYNLQLITSAQSKDDITNISTVQKTLQTYIVNKEGDITFPLLGKIHVEGMTLSELTDYLTDRIKEDVTDPIVRVALVNFKVNVMGEVKDPQSIYVKTERFSVLDALAGAGDMTQYGRRDNVLVIRESATGEKEYRRLDLQDPKVVEDPFFYLQQNDVVYVEPNDVFKGSSKYDQNKNFKLQIVATVLSTVSALTTLFVALRR